MEKNRFDDDEFDYSRKLFIYLFDLFILNPLQNFDFTCRNKRFLLFLSFLHPKRFFFLIVKQTRIFFFILWKP